MALTFLLGGARSGKSALAVRMAADQPAPVIVIATGEARDDEMAERIRRHRAARPPDWQTIEAPTDIDDALATSRPDATIIVDCLTLWVSNLLEQELSDAEIERRAAQTATRAAARAGMTVAVSNEVGMGIVADNPVTRRFTDLLGRVNAIWADAANRALLVVAGRALPLASAASLLDGRQGEQGDHDESGGW